MHAGVRGGGRGVTRDIGGARGATSVRRTRNGGGEDRGKGKEKGNRAQLWLFVIFMVLGQRRTLHPTHNIVLVRAAYRIFFRGSLRIARDLDALPPKPSPIAPL